MAPAEKYDYKLQLHLTDVKDAGHLDRVCFITKYGSSFCCMQSHPLIYLLLIQEHPTPLHIKKHMASAVPYKNLLAYK